MTNESAMCEHCNAEIGGGAAGTVVLVSFPHHLMACYVLLKGGIGCVICPKCMKPTKTKASHIVRGRVGPIIVGVGESATQEFIDRLVLQLRESEAPQEVRVARTTKEMRGLVLGNLAEPYNLLMNRFATSEDPLEWAGANLTILDEDFFRVMWLMGSGAVQVFASPAANYSGTSTFVPSEFAPDAARHQVLQKEARDHHHRLVGHLAGSMLFHASRKALHERSLTSISQDLAESLAIVLTREEVLEEAARKIGQFVDALHPGIQGALHVTYALEAALALVCHRAKVANPRSAAWSTIYLLHDVARRLGNEDEALLPTPEVSRATLDAVIFWQVYRQIGGQQEQAEPEERARRMSALIESAARLFPDEVAHHTPLKMIVRDDVPDSEAGKTLKERIAGALKSESDSGLVQTRALVEGMCETRPHLVAKVVRSVLRGKGLTDELRLELVRSTVEHLNHRGLHADAWRLVQAGTPILEKMGTEGTAARTASQFLNEMGNCLRLRGDRPAALEVYRYALELFDGDASERDFRVCRRNEAIILRELHRYNEARDIFAGLHEHAHTDEVLVLTTSEVLCLAEMGQDDQALKLLEERERYTQGLAPGDRGVMVYRMLLAFLLSRAGKLDEALATLAPVRQLAKELNYHALVMVALDIEIRLALQMAQPSGLDPMLDALQAFLEASRGQDLGTIHLASLRSMNAAWIQLGQHHRAEALCRGLASALDSAASPRAWLVHLIASWHAGHRGDADGAASDLDNAMRHFQEGISSAVSSGDVQNFVVPDSRDVGEMVARVLSMPGDDSVETHRRWRMAGDCAAAPVLTARLRKAAKLAPAASDIEGEGERLSMLLSGHVAAVVQFVAAREDIVMLRTAQGSDGSPTTTQRRLPTNVEAAQRLGRVLAFHLLRIEPGASSLGLDQIEGWAEFAAGIQAGIADLPATRHILVVAGPMQEPAVALALGRAWPISFVPSLAAALALMERRQRESPKDALQSASAFVSWFDREREEEARALAEVPAQLGRIVTRHGLTATSVAGAEATRERLLENLAQADLLWIACHGRLRPKSESVELLVAANGFLPPADLRRAHAPQADHVVTWQHFKSLARTSPVVVSSACDSGLAITNDGGERLGLERTLFPAGTHTLIAPLWPVPTVAIQAIVNKLLDTWLADTTTPLTVHLSRLRSSAVARGVSPLAAGALAVFGSVNA